MVRGGSNRWSAILESVEKAEPVLLGGTEQHACLKPGSHEVRGSTPLSSTKKNQGVSSGKLAPFLLHCIVFV